MLFEDASSGLKLMLKNMNSNDKKLDASPFGIRMLQEIRAIFLLS